MYFFLLRLYFTVVVVSRVFLGDDDGQTHPISDRNVDAMDSHGSHFGDEIAGDDGVRPLPIRSVQRRRSLRLTQIPKTIPL